MSSNMLFDQEFHLVQILVPCVSDRLVRAPHVRRNNARITHRNRGVRVARTRLVKYRMLYQAEYHLREVYRTCAKAERNIQLQLRTTARRGGPAALDPGVRFMRTCV